MNESRILCAAVNNFLVSAARLLNPSWHNNPLVIVTSQHQYGVVHSMSEAARQAGIRRGMSTSQARHICPRAIYTNQDDINYQPLSDKLFRRLSALSPHVSRVSAGKGFVDLSGCERLYGTWSAHPLGHLPFSFPADGTYMRSEHHPIPPRKRTRAPENMRWITGIGAHLQRNVIRQTGLPLSVGCASNRLAAECASRFVSSPGITLITPGNEKNFFRLLSLKDIPGIGRTTISKLKKWNVQSVDEAQQLPFHLLQRTFGTQRGQTIYNLLRGQYTNQDYTSDHPRSITRERTFWEASNDRQFVEAMLHYLVELIGGHLRHEHLSARTVHIRLRYQNHRIRRCSRQAPQHTDENNTIFQLARRQLNKRWKRNRRVRSVGLAVSDLRPTQKRQTELFAQNSERRRRLDQCVDKLRDRFGFDVVHRGPSIQMESHS